MISLFIQYIKAFITVVLNFTQVLINYQSFRTPRIDILLSSLAYVNEAIAKQKHTSNLEIFALVNY